jgi:putative transcriptional regulator
VSSRFTSTTAFLLLLLLLGFRDVYAAGGQRASCPELYGPPLEIARPDKGIFLVAAPSMSDPRFSRSVIFLLDHDRDGTIGLIVNRPTDVSLADALPGLEGIEGRQTKLFFGGPVSVERVMFLTRSATPLAQARHVIDDIYGSGNGALLQQLLKRDEAEIKLRLYLGYAGWGPGQLDRELVEGAWRLFQVDSATVFHTRPESLWPAFMECQEAGRLLVRRR